MANPSNHLASRLFAPIEPLTLSQWSRVAILRFVDERRKYDRNVVAQEDLTAVPWASCLDANLAVGLIRSRAFGAHIKDIDDLTDEVVTAALQKIVDKESVSATSSAVLDDLKKNVCVKMQEPDSEVRIQALVSD